LQGKLLQSSATKRIVEQFPYNTYEIVQQRFPEKEQRLAKLFIGTILRNTSINVLALELPTKKDLIEQFRSNVIQLIDVNELVSKLPSQQLFEKILSNFLPIAEKIGVSNPKQFASFVLNHSIGYRELSELMVDEDLEEIMVNGFNRSVFVTHRRFGNCKTSLIAEERGFVSQLINRVAATVNKQFNESHPLLDARLPDGSRVNAVAQQITRLGTCITIRKFTHIPLSIIDLIALLLVGQMYKYLLLLYLFGWPLLHPLVLQPHLLNAD